MADDRDRRRMTDPLHRTGRNPVAREESGELDVPEDFESLTPIDGLVSGLDERDARIVGLIGRHIAHERTRTRNYLLQLEQRTRGGAVEVSADARLDRIEAELDLARAERTARAKRRKWLTGALTGVVGALASALLWAVRALDERGAAGEVERQHREMNARHEVEIRQLQTDAAVVRARLDMFTGRRLPSATTPDDVRSEP